MKVFMSWSGARSRAAAEVLKWWTGCIIQASRPWISTEDVDRGALWFSEISNNLSDTSIGIVCLTHENKDRPWILFEAGALAKGLSNSRVCTFLVDLEPSDIRDPLAQFNHTQPNEQDMRKLARTLNRALGEQALADDVLADAFNAYWPQFQIRWESLIASIPLATEIVKRPADDIMGEILENVRGMNQRIRMLEAGVEKVPTWTNTYGVQTLNPQRRIKLRQQLVDLMKEHIARGSDAASVLAEGEKLGFSAQLMQEMFEQALTETFGTRSSKVVVGNESGAEYGSILKNADIPGTGK
jgi:hypothetical protein